MIAIVNNVINSDHAIGLISFILSPLATRDESLRQQKGDVNEWKQTNAANGTTTDLHEHTLELTI